MRPLFNLKRIVSCGLGALCLKKIYHIKQDKEHLKEMMKYYTTDMFGYQWRNLGLAVADLKIELLKVIGGLGDN